MYSGWQTFLFSRKVCILTNRRIAIFQEGVCILTNRRIAIFQEGVCILTGLTYNGQDENGNNLWDGCRNIYIRNFETAATLQELIQAFNVNTNRWMAK